MDEITVFRGEFRWLSNFFPVVVKLDGVSYPSVEHAFQAAKTTDVEWRLLIRQHSASDAKHMGQCCDLRPGWDAMKLAVMEDLLRQKFRINWFKTLLLRTGDRNLVEGNDWDDTYWGVCRGTGENHLGILLMKIREEMKEGKA
jgi:ribA/ribD-fused uncharacterized protein